MKKTMVVAIGTNGIIGNKGRMPWSKNKEDMAHFRKVTKDKWVVMGRKTWESLPSKKLPGRTCIVISSQPYMVKDADHAVGSWEEAVKLAKAAKQPELVLIGGGTLYEAHYMKCDEVWITHIFDEVTEGDTYFQPKFDPDKWTHVSNDLTPSCAISLWRSRRYVNRL